MQEFLQLEYFGNTVLMYFTAAGIFILIILLLLGFKKIILSRLKKLAERTDTKFDDFLVKGIEKLIIPLIYFLAFIFSIRTLNLSPTVDKIVHFITVIVLTVIAVRLTISVIKFSLNAYLGKQERAEEKQKQVRGIITITNILFWVLGLIFLLDNLGYNVSAVLAGLGIGGIAIALAAQTILGDLFSYFVIFFDRPFEIGDFIIIGDKMGTVEYVGIKTTRIRSIGGEQLVLSNTDLTNSRIHNYKRMERRRIVFSIGVVYQTKSEQLNEVPKIVKQIIQETPNTLFDRGHFSAFGDFSLNFEFVYFVLSPDFLVYRDTQQAINLKIYEEFEKRGIEFAYPTQTLFLNKETDTSTLS
jgi:small-conductance mechanosensitive channel